LECPCDGSAGAAADLAVRLVQLRQGLLEADILAVDVHADAGAQLLEQAHPGAVADRAEVGEDALLRLGELMRAELARLLDVVAVLRGPRVREQRRGLLISDRRQLQWKEHHVAAALGTGFSGAREQPAGRWSCVFWLCRRYAKISGLTACSSSASSWAIMAANSA